MVININWAELTKTKSEDSKRGTSIAYQNLHTQVKAAHMSVFLLNNQTRLKERSSVVIVTLKSVLPRAAASAAARPRCALARFVPAKAGAGYGAKARDWPARGTALAQGRRFSREQCQMVHLSRWVRSPTTLGAARSSSNSFTSSLRRSKVARSQPTAHVFRTESTFISIQCITGENYHCFTLLCNKTSL